MFPTGMAGAALFVLRVLVAASLLVDWAARRTAAPPFWTFSLFLLLAIFLCSGFLTPYCSGLSLLIHLAGFLIVPGRGGFSLAQSIVASGVLAILGPGAYSLDARLFGRKLLQVPSRKS